MRWLLAVIYYTNPGYMVIDYKANGISWEDTFVYFGSSYFSISVRGEDDSDASSFVTTASNYTKFAHQVCGFLIFSLWDSTTASYVRAVGLTMGVAGGTATTEISIRLNSGTNASFFGIFEKLNYIRFDSNIKPNNIAYCILIVKL